MAHIPAAAATLSQLQGSEHSMSISLILDHSPAGHGPRLHRHSYDEVWVIHEGALTFQLDDRQLTAGPGDVVIAPAGAAHKFTNDGPDTCNMVCIHASPTISTEWLE
jgi:mannose-6-phosphate isomerase-like protein (cupin superfamily)